MSFKDDLEFKVKCENAFDAIRKLRLEVRHIGDMKPFDSGLKVAEDQLRAMLFVLRTDQENAEQSRRDKHT